MRSEQRSRPSPASNRSAERASPLWTARRSAARPRIACRSRFAALYLVRRCFTASAPALRAASLCHACRLCIRWIAIMRNRPGLGETVAPQQRCGVKDNRRALADGKRARKGDRPMGTCVMCKRNVQQAENWIRCHLWGGFATFHWRCFGEYLRAESEERVESAVWEASRNG